jgi:hypothetical protein
MKSKKNTQLSPDSQNRLMAYTTAAGLGAFFAGQSVEAQVTESAAFAPYPATLLPLGGTGTNGYYHYFSVDGGTNAQFNLTINDPIPSVPTSRVSQFIDMPGEPPPLYGVVPTNAIGISLTPTPVNAYLVPFLGGTTISAATAGPPSYQPRLAIAYLEKNAYNGYYNYLDSKFRTTGALGFQFVGSVDGQTHFGYMNVQVNTTTNSGGIYIMQSVVIQGIYYNATPNAGITVPIVVNITSVNVAAGNAVTINFTSNDNADPSLLTLETSPTIDASADWQPDPAASITQLTSANPGQGFNQGTYQAVTTGTGGLSQFYRIVNSN